nr:opioid growth factor receptor-related protein [uncultured Lichenicoccus sp.]
MAAPNSHILDFLRGSRTDTGSHSIGQIQAWDDSRLEAVHDYIQWLFPLPEASGFNPDAPILTQSDIAHLKREPALQDALRRSWQRMLAFYRLDALGQPGASASDLDVATVIHAPWMRPGDHNMLRISRMLRCLALAGLARESALTLAGLERVFADPAGARAIGARSLGYWRDAAAARI